jgi:hypothetical protein
MAFCACQDVPATTPWMFQNTRHPMKSIALIARPPSAHRARSYSDIWFPFWNMPRSGLIITLPTITAMARRNRFIVRFPLDARHYRAGGKPP